MVWVGTIRSTARDPKVDEGVKEVGNLLGGKFCTKGRGRNSKTLTSEGPNPTGTFIRLRLAVGKKKRK